MLPENPRFQIIRANKQSLSVLHRGSTRSKKTGVVRNGNRQSKGLCRWKLLILYLLLQFKIDEINIPVKYRGRTKGLFYDYNQTVIGWYYNSWSHWVINFRWIRLWRLSDNNRKLSASYQHVYLWHYCGRLHLCTVLEISCFSLFCTAQNETMVLIFQLYYQCFWCYPECIRDWCTTCWWADS